MTEHTHTHTHTTKLSEVNVRINFHKFICGEGFFHGA